jgi:sugar fermentation stimulation protein A
MKYENMVKGKFVARPNRFIAEVIAGGEKVRAHVKNTGRCRELLVPGAEVYLEDFAGRMGTRRLRYSLIAVTKAGRLFNIDSQAPNKICEEGLLSGAIEIPNMDRLALVQREKTFGDSRLDFYVEDVCGRKGWIEVKGVTLEDGGVARFPDAPTERGLKHVNELRRARAEGYCACILFILQMEDMKWMEPNDETHRAFGDALRLAAAENVGIVAYDCRVAADQITVNKKVPVRL